LAEVYASNDAKENSCANLVAAWNKVMNLDRYDVLARAARPRGRRLEDRLPPGDLGSMILLLSSTALDTVRRGFSGFG
jgi:hypothetical protein